jgi:hypothetical protein
MLKQDAADRRFWRPHRIKMAAAVVVLLIVGFIQALIAVHLLAKRDAAIKRSLTSYHERVFRTL